MLNKENPSHLAVAFDLPTPTFRHEYYPEYKAGREKQPEDITLAIPLIHKILEAFPIPILSCESYEADDVIGTIAKQAEKEGYEVYMMTPDKDYAQLGQRFGFFVQTCAYWQRNQEVRQNGNPSRLGHY